MLFFKIVTF